MPRTADGCLIVFAKAPQPGAVKTRLAPLLGAAGAAALHAKLVQRTLETARAAGFRRLELHCAPDVNDRFLASCGAAFGATLRAQSGAGLGERMRCAFEHALAGSAHVVLIGTDCPALTADDLRAAARGLAGGDDAVFVPAEDGGYALIALARCDAALFDGIAWGGATVMEDTRARLRRLNWRWHELDTRWDVDRPEDYERLLCSGLLDGVRVDA